MIIKMNRKQKKRNNPLIMNLKVIIAVFSILGVVALYSSSPVLASVSTDKVNLKNRSVASTSISAPLFADTLTPAESNKIDQERGIKRDCENPDINQDCKIVTYLLSFINILSAVFAIVLIIVIIVAGIQYSSSAGDPQAAGQAKKRISNAILAIVVYAGTYGFLQWIVPGGLF
jgi:amino acid permease